MKILALFAAGALAVGTLVTPAPADAQRHGWDGPRGGHGHGGRGWHGPRHRYDGYRGGYRGYRGGYQGPRGGYRRHYGYGGPRGP